MPNETLFDPSLRVLRHRRIERESQFLHERAVNEIMDRLQFVKRAFTKIAVVTFFPDLWSKFPYEVEFVLADEMLKFAQADYDLIIHDMFLHCANDPLGQLIQCQRALRDDGLLTAAFFGGESLHQLRAALMRVEEAIYGGISPRVHPMIDIRAAGGLLQRANLALPVLDADKLDVQYRDIFTLLRELRRMGESNIQTARSKTPVSARFWAAVESEMGDEKGAIICSAELIFLNAWRPSQSQPRPLRPGSAQFSLDEVMNRSSKT